MDIYIFGDFHKSVFMVGAIIKQLLGCSMILPSMNGGFIGIYPGVNQRNDIENHQLLDHFVGKLRVFDGFSIGFSYSIYVRLVEIGLQ